jgi:hypothetical protein
MGKVPLYLKAKARTPNPNCFLVLQEEYEDGLGNVLSKNDPLCFESI